MQLSPFCDQLLGLIGGPGLGDVRFELPQASGNLRDLLLAKLRNSPRTLGSASALVSRSRRPSINASTVLAAASVGRMVHFVPRAFERDVVGHEFAQPLQARPPCRM